MPSSASLSDKIYIRGRFNGVEGPFEFAVDDLEIVAVGGRTLEKWAGEVGISRSTALKWQKEGSIIFFGKGARLFVLRDDEDQFWAKVRAGEFPAESNAGKFWARMRAQGAIPQAA